MMKKVPPKQTIFDKILSETKIQQQWQRKNQGQESNTDSQEERCKINVNKPFINIDKTLNKINSTNKIQDQKLRKKQQKEAQLKKKLIQMDELQIYIGQVLQENMICKKKMLEINASLKETYSFVKNNFQRLFTQDKFLITQFNQEDPMSYIKQFRKIFYVLAQPDQTLSKTKAKQEKLLEDNQNLSKTNQRLVSYIQQWKTYTEGLKQKIYTLKQTIKGYQQQKQKSKQTKQREKEKNQEKLSQIKSQQKSNQQKEEAAQSLEGIEQRLDIKYMNRSDLILLVKSIMQKLKKHSRECSDRVHKIEFDELQKFVNKDYNSQIKKSNTLTKQTSKSKQKQNQ